MSRCDIFLLKICGSDIFVTNNAWLQVTACSFVSQGNIFLGGSGRL